MSLSPKANNRSVRIYKANLRNNLRKAIGSSCMVSETSYWTSATNLLWRNAKFCPFFRVPNLTDYPQIRPLKKPHEFLAGLSSFPLLIKESDFLHRVTDD